MSPFGYLNAVRIRHYRTLPVLLGSNLGQRTQYIKCADNLRSSAQTVSPDRDLFAKSDKQLVLKLLAAVACGQYFFFKTFEGLSHKSFGIGKRLAALVGFG